MMHLELVKSQKLAIDAGHDENLCVLCDDKGDWQQVSWAGWLEDQGVRRCRCRCRCNCWLEDQGVRRTWLRTSPSRTN